MWAVGWNGSDASKGCVGAAAAALIAALAAACAGRADAGSRSWRELRTNRVIMVTDVDSDTARKRLETVDRLGAAMSSIYAAIMQRPASAPQQIRVVHLADCDDLTRRFGETARGAVTHSLDFERERIVVTCELDASLRNEVVLHELTHDLNHRYFSNLPAWLQEGLATYYQTLQIRDGKAVVGLRPQMDREFWQGVAILPTMSELRAMSEEELVGRHRRGYFAAWKLTHLLANGSDDYNRRFRAMLAGFGKVERKGDAFAASFGDLEGKLAGEYGTYHLRRETNTWTVEYRPYPEQGIRGERELRPGEALAVLMELEPLGNRSATRERILRAWLARLERADPGWSRLLYWRAVVAYRTGGGGEAPAQLLRRYLEKEPDDARAWMGLVELELDRIVPPGHLGVEPEAPPGLEEIEGEVRALVKGSNTPGQLNQIAWYYALRRQPTTAFNFAMRAIQLEPGYANCWDTLALIYYWLDRPTDAVAAQRRAIALLAEAGHPSPDLQARLHYYERAAAAGRKGPGA